VPRSSWAFDSWATRPYLFTAQLRSRYDSWAERMRRVSEVDVLECPNRGGAMRHRFERYLESISGHAFAKRHF
jgi:hypothetical protein